MMKQIKRMLVAIYILIIGISFEYISTIYCTETGDMKIIMSIVLMGSGCLLLSGLLSNEEK